MMAGALVPLRATARLEDGGAAEGVAGASRETVTRAAACTFAISSLAIS
jgi:hypothetical protein